MKNKILFTTPLLEHPPAGGAQLRIENCIKALSKICSVHLLPRIPLKRIGGKEAQLFYSRLCDNFKFTPSASNYANNPFVRIFKHSFNNYIHEKNKVFGDDQILFSSKKDKRDAEFIIDYAEKYGINIIWFGYGNISFPLIKYIKEKNPKLKTVCDTDSVWSRFILREIPFEKDEARIEEIRRIGREKEIEEKEWTELCDATTAVSEYDAEYYKSLTDRKERVHCFYNGIDITQYEKTSIPQGFIKPAVYLAGTYYSEKSPMTRAAIWLLENVWPQVKKKMPAAHLYLIGNGSNVHLQSYSSDYVHILGKIDSTVPFLTNSDAALVPLQFESGTRFKIMEAGAAGIPVISTTLGAEGIPVESGKNIVIADNPEDFAKAIVEILENKELAEKMEKNLKKNIIEKYSIEALSRQAYEILDFLK